jgi:RNA 2',3'-cyclic 3'-phosphodiesterase
VRLFVAVDVPDELKERIESQIVDVLRPALSGARWTRPEGRHLTLKFLGNVDDERVDAIAAVVDAVAARHAPFEAAFSEVGGFPNLRRPRVLWIGIGQGAEPMAALASDLERSLEPLGFEPEGRPFRGHFTLARFPKPSAVGTLGPLAIPDEPFEVVRVTLFRSQLHPKGARYTALGHASLR